MPEQFWADGKVKEAELSDHLKSLEEAKAALEAQKAGVPEKPDDYKLALPKDFELPKGIELNDKDPLFIAARDTAHKLGLSQDAFSQLIATQAGVVAAQVAAEKAQYAAEMKSLGENAVSMVQGYVKEVQAVFGEDDGALLIGTMRDAASVKAVGRILEKIRGVTPFNASGRNGGSEPGKIEGYENMNFRQRMAAADALRAAGNRN